VPKLLIVEDERPLRTLLRRNLEDSYDILETDEANEALEVTLDQKPDCILLDLMMPGVSGFDLCQTLASLTATRLTPIIVVTSLPAAHYKDYCLNLGAADYFEKPLDFASLKTRLAEVLESKQPERRTEARVRLRVTLKLAGIDKEGSPLELLTTTEDVSVGGFLCSCAERLENGSVFEVCLIGREGATARRVGPARVVRVEWQDTPGERYGFRFLEKPTDWILQ